MIRQVMRTMLTLPAPLPGPKKAALWASTTSLLSTAGFGASYAGIPMPVAVGLMALLVVPLAAGLAKLLAHSETKTAMAAKGAGA